MKPTLYLDVVWAVNFVMNGILLFLTVRLGGKKPKLWRILTASALASVYAVLIFFPQLWLLYTLFFKVLFSVLIVWVSAPIKHIRELLKLTVIFYITSFAFGGCVFAAFWLTGMMGRPSAVLGNVVVTLDFPYLLFAASVSLCCALYLFFDRWMKKRQRIQSHVCAVRLEYAGRSLIVETLLDTGCTLMEPVSQKPVFVVERRVLSGLYPEACLKMADAFYQTGEIPDPQIWETYRATLVPFSGFMKKGGFLVCFPADGIFFLDRPDQKYTGLVGVYHQTFQSEYYRALVGPEVIFESGQEGEVSCG